MGKKYAVILNPFSFNFTTRLQSRLHEVVDILRRGGKNEVAVFFTSSSGDAAALARRAYGNGFDVIVSAGGDGTLNEVANALAGTDATVGVLPIGITNVFALEMGIPMNPYKAAKVILEGQVYRIDLGEANGRKFVLMGGAGLEGLAVYGLNLELKKSIGGLAYVISGALRYFKHRREKIVVKYIDSLGNEKEIEGYEVVISNTSFHGGRFVMSPGARIDDGLLDLCVFRKKGFFIDLSYFLAFFLSLHHKMPTVHLDKGSRFVLSSEGKVYYHVDSEPAGVLPLEVAVVPASLNVILPPGRLSRARLVEKSSE